MDIKVHRGVILLADEVPFPDKALRQRLMQSLMHHNDGDVMIAKWNSLHTHTHTVCGITGIWAKYLTGSIGARNDAVEVTQRAL